MGKIEIGKEYYDIKLKTSFLVIGREPNLGKDSDLYLELEVLEPYIFPKTKKRAFKGEKVWSNEYNLVNKLKHALENL